MSKYAVEVHDVKKRFNLSNNKNNSLKRAITQIFQPKDTSVNSFNALDGISFKVEKGDFFGILGRNGSGKSTLLKIISEIYQPSSGSVKHDGKLVSFIELGVGFKAELTGRENVYLNGAMLGFSRSEIDAMYDDIVEFAELEKFMGQQLKNYSSGMKVRLAFSVAIRAKADVLILDEVLAVGDADFKRKCSEYFKTLKDDKGKTVILVTHGMGDVRNYCNKAIVIDGGKIIFQGEAEAAADEYLKLFNANKHDNSKIDKSQNRWGTGEVLIEDVKTHTDNKQFTIDVLLKSHSDKKLDGIKFGFTIINSRNQVVAGANNLNVEDGEELNLISQESKKLHFKMQNIFGNDTYRLTLTVNGDGGLTTYDKWIDAAEIINTRQQAFYPIVYPAKLTIK